MATTRNSVALHVTIDDRTANRHIDALNSRLNTLTENAYEITINMRGTRSDTIERRVTALNGLADTLDRIRRLTPNFNTNIETVTNNVQNFGRVAGQTSNTVDGLADALNNAAEEQRELIRNQRQLNDLHDRANQGLSRMQSIITAFAWHTFVKGVRDAFVELKNVDTELVTIQKVTGQTRNEVQALADESYSVAAKYGAIASDYLSSVASFARAGYKEQADALGELSLMTQKVGDVNAKTADQFLLSVDAAYEYKGSVQKLTKVLDGANEIGNKFATDVEKITAGLGIVSNVARQANVDIDEVTAALGTITAVTQRSGSEAARALRAIYLNIAADISTELDEDTGDHWTAEEIEAMATSLQKFGIYTRYVKDGMEQLRNPMEVIGELAQKVKDNEISEVELNDLLQGLGGKLRSNQLLALINRWDMYEDMLETYRDAAGSAEEELDIYLESWEAKIAKIKGNWTELVNNTINSQAVNWFLDLANSALEASDNIWGIASALGGLLTLINANKISGAFSGFGNILSGMFGGASTASAGAISVGWIGAVVAGITLLVTLYKSLDQAYVKAQEDNVEQALALRESAEEAENAYKKYKELDAELAKNEDVTEEQINTLKESAYEVAKAYGIERDELDVLIKQYGNLTDALEAAIDAKGRYDAAHNAETYAKGKTSALRLVNRADGAFYSQNTGTPIYGMNGSVAAYTTAESDEQAISGILAGYDKLLERQAELIKNHQYLTAEFDENRQIIDKVKASVENLRNVVLQESLAMYELAHGKKTDFKTFEELSEFVDELVEMTGLSGEGAQALAKYALSLFKVGDGSEEAKEKLEKANDELKNQKKTILDLAKAVLDSVDAFTGFQSSYDSLIAAEKEFNENGYLTAATFKSLADNDLLKYLDNVGDKLVFNEQALLNDAEAARAKAESDYRAAWAADLLAFAEGRVSEMSAGAKGVVSGFGDAVHSAGDEAALGASGFLQAAAAIDTTRSVLEGDELSDFNSGIDKINNYYEGMLAKLRNVKFASPSVNSPKGGGGSSKSTKEEKKNTYIDILKSMLTDADYQVEAWARDGDREEAIIAMYENVLDEIQSVMDKYRAEGYDDTSDEIQELTKLWWKYSDNIADVQEDLAKRIKSTWSELENQVNDLVEGRTDELDNQLDSLKDEYDSLLDSMKDNYDNLLDDLESTYDAQIEALEQAKDAEDQERKIEEMRLDIEEKRLAVLEAEQALLSAQNDRTVRKLNANGEWEWVADERAIQSAQESLDNARNAVTDSEQKLADYEADLLLKDTKEALKAEYEANKAALEAERDQAIASTEAERDERIAAIEAERDAFESEWDAIKKAIEEPGRDIAEILSEIATNGTPAMKEQVDAITSLLGKLGYDVAVVAGSQYGGNVSPDDLNKIKRFLTGDYSGGTFDSGGIAGIKGIMLKDTTDAETVLPPSLTKAIIQPERNAQFTRFTDDLARLFGVSERYNVGATPVLNGFGGNDSHDMVYQINGIRIGSDEAQRPFYEVMRHIAVYSNMN